VVSLPEQEITERIIKGHPLEAATMKYENDPYMAPRSYPMTRDNNTGWIVAALVVLGVIAVGIWAFASGDNRQTTTATTNSPASLTGQSTSKSGSATVGAPAGIPPSQTSGQAVAPSGSTTTGSAKQ
jgi:cytoskeletal protein RodZ